MAKGEGRRAAERRLEEIGSDARRDDTRLAKAAEKRLAKLERELADATRAEAKRLARLRAATKKREGITAQIGELLRSASGGAADVARRISRKAGDALEAGAEAAAEHAPSGESVRHMAEDAVDAVRDAAGAIGSTAARVVGRGTKADTGTAPPPETWGEGEWMPPAIDAESATVEPTAPRPEPAAPSEPAAPPQPAAAPQPAPVRTRARRKAPTPETVPEPAVTAAPVRPTRRGGVPKTAPPAGDPRDADTA